MTPARRSFTFVSRLWWRIWAAVLVSLVLFAGIMFVVWRFWLQPAQLGVPIDTLVEIATQLPDDGNPLRASRVLLRWSDRTRLDLALFDEDRRLIAAAGRPLPPPRRDQIDSHWVRMRGPGDPAAAPGDPRDARNFGRDFDAGPGTEPAVRVLRSPFALRLDDGRWLVARRDPSRAPQPLGPIPLLALIATLIGAATYFVARGLTHRLERLQDRVEAFGAGDLSARAELTGNDEAGQLASSFNDAAARIEALVQAHKNLLAHASHELRSPLARIRIAVAMMAERPTRELEEEVRRSIAELDDLIDEVLLASRLDANVGEARLEPVELVSLCAEESARGEIDFEAEASPVVQGDQRLLRRVLRNLIENARRHAGGTADLTLSIAAGHAVVEVADRGPGVPEAERERIFEPFYRVAGASERDGGVGLGLALVRQIADLHGGKIVCLPRDGGGSIFKLTLPIEPFKR
ncbi:HAMP domain-containing sensor histidine kinase [soil metagenome]